MLERVTLILEISEDICIDSSSKFHLRMIQNFNLHLGNDPFFWLIAGIWDPQNAMSGYEMDYTFNWKHENNWK